MIGKPKEYFNINGSWVTSDSPVYKNYVLQNQLIEAELGSIAAEQQRQKDQGQAASELAKNYLQAWNQSLENLTGYYNQATQSISQSWDLIGAASEKIQGIDDVVDDIESTLAEYNAAYTPLRDESIQAAREGIQARRNLMGNITDLSQADYEGASGRAKADIASEFENARRAEARELSGLGISPTSLNYQDRLRRTRVEEAVNKVLAGNLARMNEKNRVTGVSLEGLNVIKPSEEYGIAKSISQGSQNLLGMKGEMIGTGINASTQLAQAGTSLANAGTNIANSYGQNVSQPIGEMYGGALGQGITLAPNSVSTAAPKVSSSGGITTTTGGFTPSFTPSFDYSFK